MKLMKKNKVNAIRSVSALLTLALVSGGAHATSGGETGGVAGIIRRLIDLLSVSAEGLVTFGYVAGIFCFIVAFLMFKRMGGQNPGEQPAKFGGIVVAIVAGVGLIYLGSVADAGGETIFGTDAKKATPTEEIDVFN